MGAAVSINAHQPKTRERLGRFLGLVPIGVAMTLCLAPNALATTTGQIVPSFVGGKLGGGTGLHLRITVAESAGGVPATAERAIVHLPKGTTLDFAHVPRRGLCVASILGATPCPKDSQAGPAGTVRLEAAIDGKPTSVTGSVHPYVVTLHGGTLAIGLIMDVPAPFSYEAGLLVPTKDGGAYASQELIAELPDSEFNLGPSGPRTSLTELSVTIGGNFTSEGHTAPLITMPKTCPKGGFAWRADFSYVEAPETTLPATSPCPGQGNAARLALAPHPFGSPEAMVSAKPKTQFQCEKAFKTTQKRTECFNQLPGSSCAHPLIAEKAGATTRGESRYFKLGFKEITEGQGTPQYGGEQYYSYAPITNVGICPHGATYYVSLLSEEELCHTTAQGEKFCSDEYDTHSYPEPTTVNGGHFHFYMTEEPLKSWYLVVKGYFIHPPWEHRD
jgi:hypothetical protein